MLSSFHCRESLLRKRHRELCGQKEGPLSIGISMHRLETNTLTIHALAHIHTEAAAVMCVFASRDALTHRDVQVSRVTHSQHTHTHRHTVWLLIVLIWAGIPLDSISLKTLTVPLCECECVCPCVCVYASPPGLLNKSVVSGLEKRRQNIIVLTDVSTLPLSFSSCLSLSFLLSVCVYVCVCACVSVTHPTVPAFPVSGSHLIG